MRAYSLPQISYWIAYQVLPHYAFRSFEKAQEMWTQTPTSAGPFWYLMACQLGEVEPVPEDARLHTTEFGALGDSHDYYLLQFPSPPPIELSDADPEVFLERRTNLVLAPHFSALVRNRTTDEVRYFVLGQAPIGGGTTFRTVTATGANANLGPGPLPEKKAFLDRVREALR